MGVSILESFIFFRRFKEFFPFDSFKQEGVVLHSEVWLLHSSQSTGVEFTREVWKRSSIILGLKFSENVW